MRHETSVGPSKVMIAVFAVGLDVTMSIFAMEVVVLPRGSFVHIRSHVSCVSSRVIPTFYEAAGWSNPSKEPKETGNPGLDADPSQTPLCASHIEAAACC